MTPLWIVVVLLLLATLLCLIPPLLRRAPPTAPGAEESLRAFYLARREQLQRDLRAGSLSPEAKLRAEEEMQRELLQDLAARQTRVGPLGGQRAGVAAACLLSVLVPVAAVLLYGKLGNPRAAADMTLASTAPAHASSSGSDAQNAAGDGARDDMALAINALAQRLRSAPDDADGWYTLARSYETLGRYADAVAAYRQVLRLVPGQPVVLADLADALLSNNQGKPDADAIAAVAQTLANDPDQPKALALAGMMALRRGDAAEALGHWERLQALLPADSEAARQIQSNISQARAMARGAPAGGADNDLSNNSATATPNPSGKTSPNSLAYAAPDAATASTTASTTASPSTTARPATNTTTNPATAPARISGHARIADSLADRVKPDDTVFILARPVSGSRMPLAISRWRVSDLPRAFVLDDSSAMSPQATLSGASRVRVEIRISRSGAAAAQPGDLQGVLPDVDVRAGDLDLVADTLVR
ncbi:cytochrome C biogenesis protein [Achromobacter piechaudii]|uniref:c-type cytochrome biogenesis protein CcmI n=1 Tax=Achromobacter piechaudii TaxID=72556 RepID=UPI00067FFA98|nr:c-type cytochrome biogenesis protein CcmI [Achromobacter piechaudii]KNY10592.1 cytochrome C biogenesis protein [Achromobacter piechaudii]